MRRANPHELRLSFTDALGPNPMIGEAVELHGLLWSLHGYRAPSGLELYVECSTVRPNQQFEVHAKVTYRKEEKVLSESKVSLFNGDPRTRGMLIRKVKEYNVEWLEKFEADVLVMAARVTEVVSEID